jgi:pantetheine-phosphate adenylyltransferase
MASDGWDRVLLIAHLSGDLTQNAHLSPAIRVAAAHSRVRLCVILVSKQFDGSIPPPGARTEPAISHAGRWDDVQRLLTFTYVQATAIAHEKGRVLLEVDVLLRGTDAPMLEDLGSFDVLFRIQGGEFMRIYPIFIFLCKPVTDVLPIELPTRFEYLTSVAISASEETSTTTPDPIINNEVPSLYPVAALGGTFDHLHAGHKILLAMAAWIARDKLIIGLTGK